MTSKNNEDLDLKAIRARLEKARGRHYWRSLEELAATEGFEDWLHREFPRQASEWPEGEAGDAGRRQFLKLMGASLALAGLSACTRQPTELIVPYVRPAEEIIPGKPLFFATAMPLSGVATGLLVESHMGRPTKVEGNALHPASLGATDVYTQASPLGLWDPDRSQAITHLGEIGSWANLQGALSQSLSTQQARQGAGLRILTESFTSPTMTGQMEEILALFPAAKWVQYEPAGFGMQREGSRAAFGEPVNTYYSLENANVILALDSDFLCLGPAGIRYARQFANRRVVRGPKAEMNRLYSVESSYTITGAKADHRLPVRASEVEGIARSLNEALDGQAPSGPHAGWIAALARDLQANRGASVVIPGTWQSAAVHAIAHQINQKLGNTGRTVFHTDPIESGDSSEAGLRELTAEMEAGQVEVLAIAGVNPVYTAPADLNFAQRLNRVPLRIHLSLYQDETSALCHWHIPQSHYLESWSDARAFDGTVTIMQPLIEPLFGGRSAHEFLAAFTAQPQRSGYDIVRGYWQKRRPQNFEMWWRRALHDGVVEGTALPAKAASPRAPASAASPAPAAEGMEVVFRPDPSVYDGRFANNGWLQELPKPIDKLTWGNAALIGAGTAQRLNLQNEDLVSLHYKGRTVTAPVWIQPGHANESVTVHLGYGRERAGRVGSGVGFNAYALRTSDAPWMGTGLEIRKLPGKFPLAITQQHHNLEGRHIVQSATLQEYRENPDFAHEGVHNPPPELSLYPPFTYDSYAWGMAIDMTACTGCNACVVACHSENNIPVVGKQGVLMGREMHWLRIDTYHEGHLDNPHTHFQPMLCQHCEMAPCEVVCPVAATTHSAEGLNEMTYNRCVGTRYCSNNCPYKVRRFNFFNYADYAEVQRLGMNPDVTIRTRGVMEKCTYCVQRINEARIEAKREDRRIRDGDIETACQTACPARAIVFGDINDPNSRVSQLKKNELNYGVLAELNTRPRTTYLAELKNPNPEIEKA
ncbi:MAG: TAT-variant-translocated molybdopterin oxidoreductase [Bryobacteraceae bacterium]